MSKALAESIWKVKTDSSNENKTELVTRLVSDSFFVPVIAETDSQSHNISKMGYYSISAEKGSFLLVFTTIEAISAWRKDVQFLELNYSDVCGIINVENSGYTGIEIDHGGNSIALNNDFLNKIKNHIKK